MTGNDRTEAVIAALAEALAEHTHEFLAEQRLDDNPPMWCVQLVAGRQCTRQRHERVHRTARFVIEDAIATAAGALDRFNIPIRSSDRVRIIGHGTGARVNDCGRESPVHGYTRTKVVVTDADGQTRAIAPVSLAVMRRDGYPGLEGNR